MSELIPPFIPKEGGTITVRGEKFITDWYTTALTCRLGRTVVPADYINNTHVSCTFRKISIDDTPVQYLQVALNDVSYTETNTTARIYVFYVTDMTPENGVLDGGTQVDKFSNYNGLICIRSNLRVSTSLQISFPCVDLVSSLALQSHSETELVLNNLFAHLLLEILLAWPIILSKSCSL